MHGTPAQVLADRAARSVAVTGQQRLGYVAPADGTYYLEVRAGGPSRTADRYELSVARGKPGSGSA